MERKIRVLGCCYGSESSYFRREVKALNDLCVRLGDGGHTGGIDGAGDNLPSIRTSSDTASAL